MQTSYYKGRAHHVDRYWRCNYNANIDQQTPKSRQYYKEICRFRNPVTIWDLASERKRNRHCKEGMVVSPLCAGFLSRLPLWAVVRYQLKTSLKHVPSLKRMIVSFYDNFVSTYTIYIYQVYMESCVSQLHTDINFTYIRHIPMKLCCVKHSMILFVRA